MRLARFPRIAAARSLFAVLAVLAVPERALAAADSYGLGDGSDGALTAGAGTTIVNCYAPTTAFGATSITIGAVVGTGTFSNGDLVLVWQTSGLAATSGVQTPIDLTASVSNIGRYEFARVTTFTGGNTLNLAEALVNTYSVANTQVVRVPEYTTVGVAAGRTISATPFNGRTGGMVAFLATGAVTLNGTLDASGDGYRGGLVQTSASGSIVCGMALQNNMDVAPPNGAPKGEGLTGNYGLTVSGRGNAGIAGGGGNGSTSGANCHDSGGGGGGHIGTGGRGGFSVWDGLDYGGYGGAPLVYNPLTRIFMGGGGGSGRNTNATASGGGAGGGVILVRAASVSGTGTITANGATPASSAQDGAGGGGAGGSVLVRTTGTVACSVARANGFAGGNTTYPTDTDHGPGGGGAGGKLLVQSNGAVTGSCSMAANYTVAGGAAGLATFSGTAHGATAGTVGNSTPNTSPFPILAIAVTAPAAAASTGATPTISGTCSPDATVVTVYVDGAALAGTVNCSAGVFSKAVTSALSLGAHNTYAINVDSANNVQQQSATVAFDVIAAPVVALNAPGVINIANTSSYTVSGTCTTAAGTVSVSVGTVNGTTACTAGAFTANLNVTGVADGTMVAVSAAQTNAAGTTTANGTAVKDTLAPAVPVIFSPAAAAVVAPNPSITGTGEIGATVTVREGMTVVCSGVVNGMGNWTCASTLGVGSHTVTATQVDTAGNSGAASGGRTFSIPAVPTVVVTAPAVINAANAASYPVSGTCSTGAGNVSVSVGTVNGTTACTAGTFTTNLNVAGLADAPVVVVSASQTNVSGTGSDSKNTSKDVAVAAPVISTPAAAAVVASNPTLTGTGEVGATVTVREGMAVVCSGVVNGMGNWSCASTLGVGSHTVNATAVDSAGNSSAVSADRTFSIPALPVVTFNTLAVINAANASSYTVSGTCSTGQGNVSVSVGTVNASVACTAGTFAANLNVTGVADNAAVAVSASQTNVTGTGTVNGTVLKDTAAPAVPVISTPAAAAVVAPNPAITGTGEIGATVTVREGVTVVCSALVNGAGNWTCASTLGVGSHTIAATQVDVAGNTSAASANRTFSIPAAPSVTLNMPAVINVANRASYPVSGTCSTGQGNVSVSVGSVNGTAACTAGTFTINLNVTAVPDGTMVAVSASQTNVTGTGTANATTSKDATIVAPVISTPAALSFVAPNPSITGTGEVGATVTVREGMVVVCTATVNSMGNWSCTTTLGTGSHTLNATQTDLANNTSAASANRFFTIPSVPNVTINVPGTINAANAMAYTVSGTCDTLAGNVSLSVETVNGTALCTLGVFTANLNVSGLMDGTGLAITASQTTVTGTGTANATTTKDTAVAPPAIVSPASASTVAPNPQINGTSEAGATVTVREGMTVVCIATANGMGNWSCNSTLGIGMHTLNATQVDVATNTSVASANVSFTVTGAPAVTLNSPSVINAANAATYTVNGSCTTPAGTVSVSVGTVVATTPCTAGAFTTNLNVSALMDGPGIAISASQTNITGTGTANAVTNKDTVVAAPVIATPVEGGVVAPNPALTGTGEIGATVTVREGMTVVCTAVVDTSGDWTCNSTLAIGMHTVAATQVDVAGNTSVATAPRNFTIPGAPVVTLNTLAVIAAANATAYPVTGTCSIGQGSVTVSVGTVIAMVACNMGTFTTSLDVSLLPDSPTVNVLVSQANVTGIGSANGTTSKDTTAAPPVIATPADGDVVGPNPSLTGTAEGNATVTVREGMTVVCTATANAMGAWTCNSTLTSGSHTVTATQVDPAGNTSLASTAVTFSIPTAPMVTLDTPAVINVANATTYPVSGTCVTGTGTVSLLVGAVMGTATCTAGVFTTTLDVSALADAASVDVTVTQTNVAGTSMVTKTTRKDTTIAAPVLVSPANSSTVAPNPAMSGTAEASATVTVSEDMNVVCTTTADMTGAWTCASTLTAGSHTVTVSQVDGAGNTSAASSPTTFDVAPTPVVGLTAPAAVNAANAAAYTVAGTCTSGAGSVLITIGSVVATASCTMNAFSTQADVSAIADVNPLAVSASQTTVSGSSTDTKNTVKDTLVAPPVFTNPANGQRVAVNPAISGAAEPGASVTVREGSMVICTVTASNTGTFSCPTTLAVGPHALTATQTDVVGNTSAQANVSFTVANVPVVVVAVPALINAANAALYPVAGTCTAGAGDVTLSVGSITASTTCTAGMFSASVNVSALPDNAPITVAASQTNVSGTGMDAKPTGKDTVADAPTIASPAQGGTTGANPSISGSTEPGATVTVTEGGMTVCIATANSSGNWSCATPLLVGPHSITVAMVDTYGNPSPPSMPRDFTVGLVPSVALNVPGTITMANAKSYPVAGTCSLGSGTVSITVGSVMASTACTAGQFATTVDVSALPDGTNIAVTASQTDPNGTGSDTQLTTKDATALPPVFVTPVAMSTVSENPVITGTAEPRALVTVREGMNVVCTVQADGLGNFSCATTLAIGPHTVTAEQIDAAGNTSPQSAPRDFTVANLPEVTLAPLAPINAANVAMYPVAGTCESSEGMVTLTVGAVTTTVACTMNLFSTHIDVSTVLDAAAVPVTASQTNSAGTGTASGTVAKDALVPMAPVIMPANGPVGMNPVITGTGEPGATVTVTEMGMTVCQATVAMTGNWSCNSMLPAGVHELVATQEDGAGNVSPASTPVTITVTPAPTVTLGTLAAINGANAAVYTVSGTCSTGSGNVTVTVGTASAMTTCDMGVFTATLDVSQVADAAQVGVVAQQMNSAGTGTATQQVLKDTVPPAAPVVTGPTAGSTTTALPTYSGTSEPGATVAVFVDGVQVGTVTADSNGNWSFTSTVALPQGMHNVTAKATDTAGNVGPESVAVPFTVPSSQMTGPTITSPTPGSEIDPVLPVVIRGTGTPGTTITVYVDGNPVGTAVVDENGNWTFTLPDRLSEGDHTLGASEGTSPRMDVNITVREHALYLAGGGCGCNSGTGSVGFALAALMWALFLRRRHPARARVSP